MAGSVSKIKLLLIALVAVWSDASAQSSGCVLKRCIRNSDGFILYDDFIRKSGNAPCTGPDRSEQTLTIPHGGNVLFVQRFPQSGEQARCVDSSSQSCGIRPSEFPGAAPIISTYPERDGISVGEYNYAIGQNGRFVCNDGVLRRGYSSSPANSNPALLRDVVKFESSLERACVLTAAGIVRCTGKNSLGQLGIGTRGAERYGMTAVEAIGTNGADIAISDDHTCVALKSGQVSCWGENEFGQLGNGKKREDYSSSQYYARWYIRAYESAPVAVQGLPATERITSVAVGDKHSCALAQSGNIWCWGQNSKGQLGNGTSVDSEVATKVRLKPSEPARSLAVKGDQSCAVVTTGNLTKAVCWGTILEDYIEGGRGRQRLTQATSPRDARTFNKPATHLELHTRRERDSRGRLVEAGSVGCVRKIDAQYNIPSSECFNGTDRYSVKYLGGRELRNLSPAQLAEKQVVDLCPEFSSFVGPQVVKSENANCCGLLESGQAACPLKDKFFGEKELNNLGNFFFLGRAFNDPDPGAGGPSAIKQIVGQSLDQENIQATNTCMLLESGEVACAGPDVEGGREPKPISSLTGTRKLSAGEGFFCALSPQGTVSCWGKNDRRQLGNGTRSPSVTPVRVVGLPTPADELVSGRFVSCSLVGGDVYCWGNDSAPTKVSGIPAQRPMSISSLGERTCALFSGGEVWCWNNLETPQRATTAEPNAQKLALLSNGLIAYVTSSGLVGLRNPSGVMRSEGWPIIIPDVTTTDPRVAAAQPRIRDLFSGGTYLLGVTPGGRAVHYDPLLQPGWTYDFGTSTQGPIINTIFPFAGNACFSTTTGPVLCRNGGRGRDLVGVDERGIFGTSHETYPGSHRAPPLALVSGITANPSVVPQGSGASNPATGSSNNATSPPPAPVSSLAPVGTNSPANQNSGGGGQQEVTSPPPTAAQVNAPTQTNAPVETKSSPTAVPPSQPTQVVAATATPATEPTRVVAATPNTEKTNAPQCSDERDNDGDGLVDLVDLGCENAADDREDDGGVPLLSVWLEGLLDRGDGTFDAYFSYKNRSDQSILAAIGETTATKNLFQPGDANRGQPTEFAPGEHRGAFRVLVRSESLTWSVKTSTGAEQNVLVTKDSQKLPYPEPLSSCITTTESGEPSVVLGYNNSLPFEVVLPVGQLNTFSPKPADRAQPTAFFAGRNAAAFSVDVDSDLTWKLGNNLVAISALTQVCDCPVTKNARGKGAVTNSSAAIGEQLFVAIETLERQSATRLKKASERKRLQERLNTLRATGAELVVGVQTALNKLPNETRSCVQALVGCRTVDDGPTIEAARKGLEDLAALVDRIIRRLNVLENGASKRNKKSLARALRYHNEGIEGLAKIPRFRTVCQRAAGETAGTKKQRSGNR